MFEKQIYKWILLCDSSSGYEYLPKVIKKVTG